MDSLDKLILKHGEPDALIDHWDKNAKRMAIWGFKEIFIYDSSGCHLNGEKLNGIPIDICNEILERWKNESNSIHAIGYISYDFKNALFPHLNFKNIKQQTLLWFGKPKLIKEYTIENGSNHIGNNKINMILQKDIPNLRCYQKKVEQIKHYMKLGETYQINYSNPIDCIYDKSKFNLYMYLRGVAKPNNGFYLNTGKNQILSMSPEKFFEVNDNIIHTYPIKGTINRSANYEEDEKLKTQLKNSSKDKAEHLMIVDLLRNDLGKICNYGTVAVNDLYKIKSFETIHHMETNVYGQLLNNIQFKDIIHALFPSGSITGAPKERSMEIIDEVENYNRGIYTGSIGYISKNGYMNFNVAIRTICFNGTSGRYPVGGGIVWDSTPDGERTEAINKAQIINELLKNERIEYA